MTMRFVKWLAWITIIGGVLLEPVVCSIAIAHHLDPRFNKYESYLIPMEVYTMIFGMIGSVTWGAALLILLDIKNRIQADGTALKEF